MANAHSIQLEIVTPEGVMLSENVDEFVAPGLKGEFGVLQGHLPILAGIHVGLVRYTQGGDKFEVAVGKGFAEVVADKAVLLTDRFMAKNAAEEGILSVREKLNEVETKIDSWDGDLDDSERVALIEDEQWYATVLELYGDGIHARILLDNIRSPYESLMDDLDAGDDAQSGEGQPEADA